MPSNEPETIYASSPKGLGETEKTKGHHQALAPVSSDDSQKEGCQNRGEGFLFGQVEGQVKSDIDMLRSAIARHGRWPIPMVTRINAAAWLAEVASSTKYDGRARVNAVKALADLDKLNMEEELRASGGARVNLDVTSGGKPLGATEYARLSTEQLEELLKQREIRG